MKLFQKKVVLRPLKRKTIPLRSRGEGEEIMMCSKCGSDNIMMGLNIQIKLPRKYEGRITKAVMRSKEVQLLSADWDSMWTSCEDCGLFTESVRMHKAMTEYKQALSEAEGKEEK